MQTKLGVVSSTKMNKVAVVKVTYKVKHPFYKKIITTSRNFKAQNDLGAQVGQKVKLTETRPISKHVFFKISEVLE